MIKFPFPNSRDCGNGRQRLRARHFHGRDLNNECGSATVLVVMFLPVALLLLGWSVDAGRVMAAKVELYKATDIAAHELAKEIDVREAARTGEQVRHDLSERARDYVDHNVEGLGGGRVVDVSVEESSTYVQVTSSAEVPLFFSYLTGRDLAVIIIRGSGRLRRIRERP